MIIQTPNHTPIGYPSDEELRAEMEGTMPRTAEPMKEYRCIWQQIPWVEHPNKRATFIEATSAEVAKAILIDHVQRQFGIGGHFTLHSIEEYTRPTGGRVLE